MSQDIYKVGLFERYQWFLDENYRIISKRSKIKIKKPRDSGEFLGIIILKLGSLVFSIVIIFNSAIVPFQNIFHFFIFSFELLN